MSQQEPPDKFCDCDYCKDMCRRPCIPTPNEARNLIQYGYGDRLRIEKWYIGDGKYVTTVLPRSYMFCTFQKMPSMHCELHALGLKPWEGRKCWCGYKEKAKDGDYYVRKEGAPNIHDMILEQWDTREGLEAVQFFQAAMEGGNDASNTVHE